MQCLFMKFFFFPQYGPISHPPAMFSACWNTTAEAEMLLKDVAHVQWRLFDFSQEEQIWICVSTDVIRSNDQNKPPIFSKK